MALTEKQRQAYLAEIPENERDQFLNASDQDVEEYALLCIEERVHIEERDRHHADADRHHADADRHHADADRHHADARRQGMIAIDAAAEAGKHLDAMANILDKYGYYELPGDGHVAKENQRRSKSSESCCVML